MRRFTTYFKMLLVVGAMLFVGTKLSAQTLIAGWDFQTTTSGGTAVAVSPSSPNSYSANVGSGTLYLDGTNGSSSWITATTGNEVTAFGGTALNAGGNTGLSTTTTSPAALALVGGASNSANGKSIVFKFSMTGQLNLSVSYATQRTSTGFTTHDWYYSTNGTDWTFHQSVTTIPSSFAVTTLNNIAALANYATVYLKVTFLGSTSSSSNNRLDNIQLNGVATPQASTPTFSVVTGNYVTQQSVAITSTTPSSTIYYTIDGSDPLTSSTKLTYTGAINVSSTTTVKAYSSASGYNDSGVASATYTFPTDIADISAVRALTNTSGFYKLTSESLVTYSGLDGTKKISYIQDASAGILIYDNNSKITTSYTIGDKLKDLYFTLTLYNGMLEIVPYNYSSPVSTGNSVTPKIITIDKLSENLGQLVKITNVTVSDVTGGNNMFGTAKSFPLSDGTNSAAIRVAYSDLPYINYVIPTGNLDITGVVLKNTSWDATNILLVPRSLSDFSKALVLSTSNPSAGKAIYALNGNIVLTAEAGDVVEVFSASGQRLVSVKAVAGENRIPVAAKGVVLVRAKGQMAKVAL